MRRDDSDSDDYIDVRAPTRDRGRRESAFATHDGVYVPPAASSRDDSLRLARAVVDEQKALLACERARADDAEDELHRVTALADALTRKLDELSTIFEARARATAPREIESATASAAATRLKIENERLRRDMKEMEERHAREIEELRALTSTNEASERPPLTKDERRRLLREVAEAREEIAVAKEARAKALAEAVELRDKLEHRSGAKSPRVVAQRNPSPPKTPQWANVDWDAAHAEFMKTEMTSPQGPRQQSHAPPRQQSFEDIDWEAAYADMEATRAQKREERAVTGA